MCVCVWDSGGMCGFWNLHIPRKTYSHTHSLSSLACCAAVTDRILTVCVRFVSMYGWHKPFDFTSHCISYSMVHVYMCNWLCKFSLPHPLQRNHRFQPSPSTDLTGEYWDVNLSQWNFTLCTRCIHFTYLTALCTSVHHSLTHSHLRAV